MTTASYVLEHTATDEPADALSRLREVARSGSLAERYGSVAPLLAEIAAGPDPLTDLARAGRLLSRVDADEALRHGPGLGRIRAAVAGHSTVAAVVPSLTAELARHRLVLDAELGDFDGYLRELGSPDSPLYAPGLDLALVILDAQVVFDDLPETWRVEDVGLAARETLARLDALAGRYAREGSATLVLNTVPLQHTHTHQLIDLKSRAALGAAWRSFNAGLLDLSARHERVVVLDLDPLIAAGGPVGDPRTAVYAKAHLGDELLARYAREVSHLARALRGMSKKVLAVDLDNTLWDGILGDDGPEGIHAATTFRGEAFGGFQQVVKQLGSQGVLLAVSSKNDLEPVLRVLREHPDMVLREEDFARINANWDPKDANLREIADRLGLGADAFVFADDSAFETELVAASLPAVAVVRLDDEPAEHIGKLLADGWFDVLELTAEDRGRTEQYRTEAARRDLQDGAGSYEEYLRRLDVRVAVSPVGEGDVARVSQITLRANQFNLTTRRLSPADVASWTRTPGNYALCIRSADRFGDNGVVGALFAKAADDGLRIDNMLLSCRVFSRGIEQAAVAALLAHARAAGLGPVWAEYEPSAKNHRVRDFWPSLGFVPAFPATLGPRCGEADDVEVLVFRHDLAELPAVPGHLRLEADFPE
ncbi:MAG TPA: HAD-IIIC family phosphatase [Actinocrinis sp.]|uniref:HAD-IIIC family phosphatase n=1 Tax=Actinocrinis sp. TaxID=1920516 RepID=UPI002DDCED61|nr:HAD-IIIC family phosphatase [Actinocrinis sp.]HEV3170708.1 HAD-IIIC family phosphatase [Actinocrinis sp.]